MLEWVLSPIDATRIHDMGGLVSWHARCMFLGWGVLLPLGVFVARYCKVTRRQNWPEQLDNTFWWHSHLGLQISGIVLTVLGAGLIWQANPVAGLTWHGGLGWAIVALASCQFASGWLRGTKGGPTDPNPDGSLRGDHYDMTPHRRRFEVIHKSLGYGVVTLALVNILIGLWTANAPIWMWLCTALWWAGLLIASFLQERHHRPNTYQAIWGPDPKHPGNTS